LRAGGRAARGAIHLWMTENMRRGCDRRPGIGIMPYIMPYEEWAIE